MTTREYATHGAPFGTRCEDGRWMANADELQALDDAVELETHAMRQSDSRCISLMGAFNVADGLDALGHLNRRNRPYSVASVRKMLKEHGFKGDCECHAEERKLT